MQSRSPVIGIGIHRSGTSLPTRVLHVVYHGGCMTESPPVRRQQAVTDNLAYLDYEA